MAPSAGHRSGINRKAQLGIFAGYLVAGTGAFIGAALLIISIWRPDVVAGLRSMALDLTAPAGQVGAAGRTGSKDFFEAVAGYYKAGQKNADLEQEVQIARVKLAEAEAVLQENARLKAAITLVDNSEQRPITAGYLIGSSSSSTRRFAYLSAGGNQGVKAGMPVTSPLGLVGRVLESGRNSSRVLLLTDSESIVPVRRATDEVVAFAEGRADGSLRLKLINLGLNPIKEGDVFVTSGAGGLFRPGVAVAVAKELTEDGAIAQLLSNPAATDIVLVEQVWMPEIVRTLSEPIFAPLDTGEDDAANDDRQSPAERAPNQSGSGQSSTVPLTAAQLNLQQAEIAEAALRTENTASTPAPLPPLLLPSADVPAQAQNSDGSGAEGGAETAITPQPGFETVGGNADLTQADAE